MANAQVAQYLAHKGIATSVSGSAYTLTANDFDARVVEDLVRALGQWKFGLYLVSNDLVAKPLDTTR